MPSKCSQIAMTTTEIDEFPAVPRTLNVATIGPSGRYRPVPESRT